MSHFAPARRARLALLIALPLLALAADGAQPPAAGVIAATQPAAEPTASAPASQPVGPFTAEQYLAHVRLLADDHLEGRRPGTPGIEEAAEYIATQFRAFGLEPCGDDGTFFQSFEIQRGKKLVDAEAHLEVIGLEPDNPNRDPNDPSRDPNDPNRGPNDPHRDPNDPNRGPNDPNRDRQGAGWELRKDWIPLPFTDTADVEGPLAFAGYGVEAELHDYNDYKDFDASGKVLLIFRYEPAAADPEATFGGKRPSRYALFNRKAATAAKHGALGLLIVNPTREGQEDKLFEFTEEQTQATYDLPMAHISRAAAARILRKAGLPDLDTLQQKLDSERTPQSADLNLEVKLRTGVRPNGLPTRNVAGLLKGSGETKETIVVGAHYDHLGRVSPQFDPDDRQPVVHNGADDNASGTAAVLELARVLAREGGLRRNVLFVAFSAEELGLLGSKHFVQHPPVPLDTIRFMVNFDMVGRLKADRFTIFGTGSAHDLAELVARAARDCDVQYREPGGLAAGSDHASFYYSNIPFLFPFTGIHKQYHRPDDDWELIDAEGATKILAMFRAIVRDLADLEQGPTFRELGGIEEPDTALPKPGVEHEKEAQEKAEAGRAGGDVPDDARQAGRPRVRLGIVPDFQGTSSQPGVAVDAVMDGPAKTAGIREGDRIIRIGERKLKDIYAYMDALRDFKAGDKVDVVVVRKVQGDDQGKDTEQELTFKVELTESPRRRDPQ